VSREAVEGCVEWGVRERPPAKGTRHFSFMDPSGSSSMVTTTRKNDAYLDDDICEDGESVRVPMMICDASGHRPGRPLLSDEMRKRRRAIRDEYVAALQAAWKSPAHGANQNINESGHLKVTRNNVARAADADEDPSARASAVEKQLERWQGRDFSELAREVEARRRAVHAGFAERLSNAWRGGK
jgi:hypothetical protein